MRTFPENEYDLKDLAELNAEEWQADLLKLNPRYVYWGPHEDYMSKNGNGWDSRIIKETWKQFGPWRLDELNEVVNFYFDVQRDSKDCSACGATGYSPEVKKLADDWYDFDGKGTKWVNNITQDEVQALIDNGRLFDFSRENPTAQEVNDWSRKGLGHDAINRSICIKQRAKRLGYVLYCPECEGSGYLYTAEQAHVSLVLWFLHPRKGCSRGVEITKIEREDIPAVIEYLKNAAKRNAHRFEKLPGTKIDTN